MQNTAKKHFALFFAIVFISSTALASSSINGQLAGFSAERNQQEQFQAGITYTTSLRLSTQARILSGGAENDLQTDSYICPGQITATAIHSFPFPQNQLDATGEKPGGVDIPRRWNGNERHVSSAQLDNALFSTIQNDQDIRATKYLINPTASDALSSAQQDFGYIPQINDNPTLGAAREGVLCTGNTEISISGNRQNINFDGAEAQYTTNAGVGDASFQEKANILDCHGIVQPLTPNLQPLINNRKYVFYTEGGSYQQSTQYTPSITIHVRSPQVSATGAITRINNQQPPQALQMQTGAQVPIELSITNAAAGAPRKVRVTSVSSNNNAISFSAPNLPSAYIDAGASRTIAGTLTANSAFNGQLNLILTLESDGIVCDGSIPRPQVSLPLNVQITEPPRQYPDLQISRVDLSANPITIGDDLRFTATIRNSGNAIADESTACLNITKANGARLQTIRVGTSQIAQGASTQISFTYNSVQGPAGQNSYSIIADCDNEVNENANEENNRATGNFNAEEEQQQELPNIHMQSITVPQSPEQGTSVSIQARITLTGNVEINNQFDNCLTLTAPSGASITRELPIDSLEIDNRAVDLLYQNLPINEVGQYSASVQADCHNDIQESNNNDNSITEFFTSVQPPPEELPNLQAQIVPVAAPENLFCPGDSVRINFTVINPGEADAIGVFRNRIHITEPDGSEALAYFNIISLPAGQQSRVFSMNYNLPDTGTYLINATADFFGALQESDETDNSETSDFDAQRSLPNLHVSNVSYASQMENITTDTLVIVNVSVENNGCVGMESGTQITLDSQIRNRPPAILTDFRSYQEGLAAGQEYVFSDVPFQLTQSFYGRNLFQAFIDRENAIEELRENDNEGRWIFTAGQGQGGGHEDARYCYIQSPSSPIYKSGNELPVLVQYVNYQPREGVEFDCGNGENIMLSCENDEDGGASCSSQAGCTYEDEGNFPARTLNPEEVTCSLQIDVSLDDLSRCMSYI